MLGACVSAAATTSSASTVSGDDAAVAVLLAAWEASRAPAKLLSDIPWMLFARICALTPAFLDTLSRSTPITHGCTPPFMA
jgi:hypothetical protein